MSQAPLDAASHLALCLQLAQSYLRRYIALHGHRMLQASGTLDDLYVSFSEAEALWEGPGPGDMREPLATSRGWPTAAALTRRIAQQHQELEARLHQTFLQSEELRLPLWDLQQNMGWSPQQWLAWWLAAAPGLNLDLARLYTFAWADFAHKRPTAGFLAELLAGSEDSQEALALYRPDGPLVSTGLLWLHDHPSWGRQTPLLHRLVTAPEAALRFVRGWQPSSLPGCAHDPPFTQGELWWSAQTRGELQRGLRQLLGERSPQRRLALLGQAGAGRRSLVQSSLGGRGPGVLVLKLHHLARDPHQGQQTLQAALLQARLHQLVLLLRCDELSADKKTREGFYPLLQKTLEGYTGPVILTAPGREALPTWEQEEPLVVHFPLPDAPQRAALWSAALKEHGGPQDPQAPRDLGDSFSLTPGAIERAVEHAAQAQHRRGPLPQEALRAAVRRDLDHGLDALAERVTSSLAWEDVILPPEVMALLHEVVDHARYQHQVYEQWGFRRKMAYGRGLSCLFAGPPGTGKTMMAGVLANSLRRDLYRIDLSRISSKWIGETEKNLARLFTEARKAQVVLLFDEADSLFSSRTKVSSANDRFANMEINYLLQQMESYEGTTILTTNFEQGLDEAFKRRLRFRITFPIPEEPQRQELWRSMIPAAAQASPEVDYAALARDFPFAGGNIKNAVLRAAFHAAREQTHLQTQHLYQAATAEAREMGFLVPQRS